MISPIMLKGLGSEGGFWAEVKVKRQRSWVRRAKIQVDLILAIDKIGYCLYSNVRLFTTLMFVDNERTGKGGPSRTSLYTSGSSRVCSAENAMLVDKGSSRGDLDDNTNLPYRVEVHDRCISAVLEWSSRSEKGRFRGRAKGRSRNSCMAVRKRTRDVVESYSSARQPKNQTLHRSAS